ncbi:MAG TPA: CDP-archaeol synthase [Burkholderiales bacterium]
MSPEAELLLLHLKLLLLLGVANGAPILGHRLLRQRFAHALDGGARFFDGRPVFGPSKTLRGVALALGATPLAALALGLDPYIGFAVGLYAMLGDLTSSFVKRRLGMPPSSQAFGLDQVPESLFPLLAVRGALGLAMSEVALLVAVFVILELAVSRVLFKLRLRDQPY